MNNEKKCQKMNEKVEKTMQDLFENSKENMDSFINFMQTVESGKVDKKTKELIAISLAVKAQCDLCIHFHVKKAMKMGIKKEEIIESAWMAVLMGGGPSLMYMGYVFNTIKEMEKENL